MDLELKILWGKVGATKDKPYKLYNLLLGKPLTCPGNMPRALTLAYVSIVRRWDGKSQFRVTAAGGTVVTPAAHRLCTMSARIHQWKLGTCRAARY